MKIKLYWSTQSLKVEGKVGPREEVRSMLERLEHLLKGFGLKRDEGLELYKKIELRK